MTTSAAEALFGLDLPFSEDSNSSAFDIPSLGIEAEDLSSLLTQFEEASQSLDGTATPPETEPEPEKPAPPVIKTKPAQIKAQECTSPAITPPATPPPEVLARIRAKRKRKLAIMLPTLLPVKLKGQSPGKTPNGGSQAELNNNTTTSETISSIPSGSTSLKPDVNSDYFEHIFDHDYCVNSPIMSPKRDKVDQDKSDSQSSGYISPDILVNVDEHVNEVIIDAGDTGELNSNVVGSQSVDLEDGEVVEDPAVTPTELKKSSDSRIKKRQTVSKTSIRSRRNYRKRGSPGRDTDRYFDKIPAYFTTLSKPVKPPKKDKQPEQQSGIRREDFIARDSSPSRNEPGVFDKLPAYYSCFTNSTRYDQGEHETYDLEDLDAYPCAKKPRKQSSSVSRSRSRSYSRSRSRSYSRSRSRSRSYSRSRSRHRSCRRRRSYSSASGSSSSSSRSRSRSRSKSYSRSRSRSRSRSHSPSSSRSRPRSHSSYRSYRSRSRSRGRSRSRSRGRNSSWARSRSRSRSFERRRLARQSKREEEKNKQIEERRIVYVGKIPEGYTRRELRKRFGRFGDIEDVSVHFREYGDNYGFVTFNYTCDAYAAIEQGNLIPGEKSFDLCFGGRRQFCDTDYADLDGNAEAVEEFAPLPSEGPLDFDQLLKQAQSKIKRKR
ncbi:peroxisome proliferator-activated receptor gamma coactivator 1-alpha-like isoform X2 [Haliotis rufescens]|uniref:peroxisome proliferator-activated receptor gamma coactivator 1-alpha-like isoform X2 n=1 Tax=Haliotis rufescens TaxID=6454 RepID=UPI00201F893F|nr:peroxisome proliferator-activated receptor gamma coactivator 1-alpha-like isoform X2 [Haliotis rufescens]